MSRFDRADSHPCVLPSLEACSLRSGADQGERSSASLHALAEAAVLARLEAKLGVHTAAEAVAGALREST